MADSKRYNNMILLTAFKGETNSSKILLDRIADSDICKLYLTNSFEACNKEIIEAIEKTKPDYIFAFGQKPKSKKLYIETTARRNGTTVETSVDMEKIEQALKSADIPYCVSNNAGNYLCNHVYYSGLDYIKQHKLHTKMLFIHVPSIKNFTSIRQTYADELQEILQRIDENDFSYCFDICDKVN